MYSSLNLFVRNDTVPLIYSDIVYQHFAFLAVRIPLMYAKSGQCAVIKSIIVCLFDAVDINIHYSPVRINANIYLIENIFLKIRHFRAERKILVEYIGSAVRVYHHGECVRSARSDKLYQLRNLVAVRQHHIESADQISVYSLAEIILKKHIVFCNVHAEAAFSVHGFHGKFAFLLDCHIFLNRPVRGIRAVEILVIQRFYPVFRFCRICRAQALKIRKDKSLYRIVFPRIAGIEAHALFRSRIYFGIVYRAAFQAAAAAVICRQNSCRMRF